MKAETYITFNGNCEEAMNFYKDVLQGEFTTLMRFGEAPPDIMQIPEDAKNLIMHCTLSFDDCILMASDTIDENYKKGNNFSVSLGTDEAKAEKIFNAMAQGGAVTMPFADAFWGGKFGMLTDQFGIQWMLGSDHKPND